MPEFLHDNALEKIKSLIEKDRGGKGPVKLAVAFWGENAIKELGLDGIGKKVQIICNLMSGATNPDEIETAIKNKNFEIRHNSNLHAKVYWTSGGAVVGSSNVSANGLNFEGPEMKGGWIEANILIENDASVLDGISEWFDDLWDNSKDISKKDLKDAKEIWERRRRSRAWNHDVRGNSILNELVQNPSQFRDRRIYFVFIKEGFEVSEEAETLFQKTEYGQEKDYKYYENWTRLPEESYLISFNVVVEEWKATFDYLWYVPKDPHHRETDDNGEGAEITVCKKINNIAGMKLTKHDKNKINSNIENLWNKAKENGNDTGGIISLFNAYEILK